MEYKMSPVKAIRQKCLECGEGSANEVKLCPVECCPLYPFRFGKNPYRQKRELTDEQRARMAERMHRIRSAEKFPI